MIDRVGREPLIRPPGELQGEKSQGFAPRRIRSGLENVRHQRGAVRQKGAPRGARASCCMGHDKRVIVKPAHASFPPAPMAPARAG
ncbi:hypothetical protein AcidC75_03210 [Acidisoma sp. C75]